MSLPPETVRQREWILDGLARLLACAGVSDFVFGPLYLAEERWFPDEWRRDVSSAKAMLDRLMAYARLGRVATLMRTELDPARALAEAAATTGGRTTHRGAAAWFEGANSFGTYLFGVETTQLEDPGALAGVLAHEVAHAWRFRNDVVVGDDAEEERLTDLTTVFLGFGALTTNIAGRLGVSAGTRFATGYGYLTQAELGFALAVQLALRNDGGERAQVLDALAQDQRVIVKEALAGLAADLPGLVRRLGLPAREAWPRPRSLHVPRPVKLRATSAGPHEVVFRVRTSPVPAFAVTGLVVGAVLAFAVSSSWPLLLPVAGAVAALFLRRDLCSGPDCGKTVPRAAERCPSCGGRVVGRIRRRRDHARAEQDFLDVSDLDIARQARELVAAALRRGPPEA